MERRDDGIARAINVIHRPWCGSHGALRLYGDNDTSTRPSTDWRGRPCGMRLSGGRRYRWDYDAIKLIAARDTLIIFASCRSNFIAYGVSLTLGTRSHRMDVPANQNDMGRRYIAL